MTRKLSYKLQQRRREKCEGKKGEKEEVCGLNKRSIKLEESEELETVQI